MMIHNGGSEGCKNGGRRDSIEGKEGWEGWEGRKKITECIKHQKKKKRKTTNFAQISVETALTPL